MSEDWTRTSPRLKLLVGTMTALLVLGLALLVVGVVRTAGEFGGELGDSAADEASFGETDLALPAGARLITMSADRGRLYLHVREADGGEAILVVDGTDGRLLGRIRLQGGPP
jgi:hypothetical protein